MEYIQSKFREFDSFHFTSFFGLDFFKFSGPLCCTIFPILAKFVRLWTIGVNTGLCGGHRGTYWGIYWRSLYHRTHWKGHNFCQMVCQKNWLPKPLVQWHSGLPKSKRGKCSRFVNSKISWNWFIFMYFTKFLLKMPHFSRIMNILRKYLMFILTICLTKKELTGQEV